MMNINSAGFPGTVIVLTQNDSHNIQYCLDSVIGWAKKVIVIDSFSIDGTAEIARARGAEVVEHEFIDFATQRNWALDNLVLVGDWVFSLDSDEQATKELKEEIENVLLKAPPEVAALAVRQAFIFLGRHLRHAQGGPFLVRIFRKGRARWYCEGARDYCIISGRIKKLKNYIRHEDHKGISSWIDKHNRYSSWEALQLADSHMFVFGPQEGDGRSKLPWRLLFRKSLYNQLPLVIRCFLYFFYRYFIRLGFLDRVEGFVYCFLQALWYPLLVDIKLLEMRKKSGEQLRSVENKNLAGS